jgi:hypothetical protein
VSGWDFALALVIAIGLAAVSLPLFRPRRPWGALEKTELDRLFEAKARVLRTIKDLDHEHAAGLLSDADWKESRKESLGEAVRLNREITALTGVETEAAATEEAEAVR